MWPEVPPPPLGFGAIQRVERVSLPDGTTYSLTATWTKDPHFQITKEVATQTSEDISQKPAPVYPVWRKELSVLPDRHLYLRTELYVVMGVV